MIPPWPEEEREPAAADETEPEPLEPEPEEEPVEVEQLPQVEILPPPWAEEKELTGLHRLS